jgi:hypothetical protein
MLCIYVSLQDRCSNCNTVAFNSTSLTGVAKESRAFFRWQQELSNIRSGKETFISREPNIQMQQIETICLHIAPLQYHQAAKPEKPTQHTFI